MLDRGGVPLSPLSASAELRERARARGGLDRSITLAARGDPQARRDASRRRLGAPAEAIAAGSVAALFPELTSRDAPGEHVRGFARVHKGVLST